MNDHQRIDEMGGTAEVARMVTLKMPSVSDWKENGIPRPWRLLFGFVRPDLFPDEAKQAKEIKRRQAMFKKST